MVADRFQDKQVARAIERLEDLSEWGVDFIMSLADSTQERFTDKQTVVLNRIIHKLDFGD